MKEIILAIDKELSMFKSILIDKSLCKYQKNLIFNQYKEEIISIKDSLNKYLDLQLSIFEDL